MLDEVTFHIVNSASAVKREGAIEPAGEIVASEDAIAFEDAMVVTPADATLVRDLNLSVPAGTNLLVTGPNGSGKSSLFRVLGGLWPLTKGRIHKPGGTEGDGLSHDIFYVPQRPYVTLGTLEEQLIYPLTASGCSPTCCPCLPVHPPATAHVLCSHTVAHAASTADHLHSLQSVNDAKLSMCCSAVKHLLWQMTWHKQVLMHTDAVTRSCDQVAPKLCLTFSTSKTLLLRQHQRQHACIAAVLKAMVHCRGERQGLNRLSKVEDAAEGGGPGIPGGPRGGTWRRGELGRAA